MAPDEQTDSFSRAISLAIDVSIEWRQFQDGESESLTARENCKKYVYFYTGPANGLVSLVMTYFRLLIL